MNGNKYLLDTCFILGVYQRSEPAMALLANETIQVKECAISVISRMEILGFSGLTMSDEYNLTTLIKQLILLPLTAQIETETIRLRKANKIKLPDAIILATANVHSLQLITLDKQLLATSSLQDL